MHTLSFILPSLSQIELRRFHLFLSFLSKRPLFFFACLVFYYFKLRVCVFIHVSWNCFSLDLWSLSRHCCLCSYKLYKISGIGPKHLHMTLRHLDTFVMEIHYWLQKQEINWHMCHVLRLIFLYIDLTFFPFHNTNIHMPRTSYLAGSRQLVSRAGQCSENSSSSRANVGAQSQRICSFQTDHSKPWISQRSNGKWTDSKVALVTIQRLVYESYLTIWLTAAIDGKPLLSLIRSKLIIIESFLCCTSSNFQPH